jgi:hypothetical protein
MPVLLDPNEILESEYPIHVRSLFKPAIHRAYRMVNLLVQDTSWINWHVGRDLIGYLKRVAVDYEIKRLIDEKRLPDCYGYRIAPNVADNCYHLEVFGPNSILTISQVRRPTSVPRHALFRANHGVGNQTTLGLFEDDYDITDKPFYFILTHGFGGEEPEFIVLGMPNPEVTQWIKVVNLFKEIHVVDTNEIERIEASDLVALKQHLLGVQNNHDT